MNKKLNVIVKCYCNCYCYIKVIENVDCEYLDTKIYIEENLKEKT